jgi:hypothetical protein
MNCAHCRLHVLEHEHLQIGKLKWEKYGRREGMGELRKRVRRKRNKKTRNIKRRIR